MTKKKETVSTKKFTIVVAILSVALVIAIGGLFGVYAASQQNVKTSFSIGYTVGNNVAVALNAMSVPMNSDTGNPVLEEKVWFTGVDKWGTSLTPQENNLYALDAETPDRELSLEIEDITFSNFAHFLVFYFENLSDEHDLKVIVTNSIVPKNMQIHTFVGGEEGTDGAFGNNAEPLSSNNFTVPAGGIVSMFLILQPIDHNKSASFETTGTTGVSFIIQKA